MKIHGLPLRNTSISVFQLRRGNQEPVTLQLRPLSLGFHQRLRDRGILQPCPPVKIARDSQGKPMRDSQGMAVTLVDRNDPEYLQEVERYHQRVALLSVVESLQGDPQITFETAPPLNHEPTAWVAYCEELADELEKSGFAAGDLLLLCREICRLSNLIDVDLNQARQNFSPAAAVSPG